MKRKVWITGVAMAITIPAGLLLLFALLPAYIDPSAWWLPSLAGLAFPMLWFGNFLILFAWLFIRKKFALVPLLFLLASAHELPLHLQFNTGDKESPTFSILNFNVRNFDLYNWTENKETRDRILKVLRDSKAGVICLQEFFNTTDPGHDFKTLDTILRFGWPYNWHLEYTATVKKTENWGIATFSTFPITGRGRILFEENSNNICIYTDILVGLDTLRIYNVHLASIKFEKAEYEYLEKVMDDDVDDNLSGGRSLVEKLHSAFIRRVPQVKKVREHMDSSPYKIILCGDFNDTPSSYTYHELSRDMTDSFTAAGNGFGATYNGDLPMLRIDYVFTSPELEVTNHEIIRADISDHFPLIAGVKIPD